MVESILEELSQIIKKRKNENTENSYVSKIFKKGKVKIANKLGEEAVETISAFLAEGKQDITEESADLLFHLLILLEQSELSINDVLEVLRKRMKND